MVLPPSLSGLLTEFPLSSVIGGDGGGSGSTSALVAFPINIQPEAGGTLGSNLIIQAQNMGQPFLLTPTPSEKQTATLTPPTSYSAIKDLEQLKLQYDKIYQQISETLQFHEQNKQDKTAGVEEQNREKEEAVGTPSALKRQHEQPSEDGTPKRPHLETAVK